MIRVTDYRVRMYNYFRAKNLQCSLVNIINCSNHRDFDSVNRITVANVYAFEYNTKMSTFVLSYMNIALKHTQILFRRLSFIQLQQL